MSLDNLYSGTWLSNKLDSYPKLLVELALLW